MKKEPKVEPIIKQESKQDKLRQRAKRIHQKHSGGNRSISKAFSSSIARNRARVFGR